MTLELDDTWEDMRSAALQAMSSAHAPYSNFRVGAVLETPDGRRYVGCNVENASYPVTMCAERVALGSAVVDGATTFGRLFLCADSQEPAPPCGMCRQALAEFAPDLVIVSEGTAGTRVEWRLADLLPAMFRLRPPASDGGPA
ncbi:MAG: cytidine deaminase [Gemmatimonadota bacterium]|nr:cytidine deaminase [Gemmatimonadota bacterium]MDH3427413.1 cytidine deaminase [Gemmatimonadota bacterium]